MIVIRVVVMVVAILVSLTVKEEISRNICESFCSMVFTDGQSNNFVNEIIGEFYDKKIPVSDSIDNKFIRDSGCGKSINTNVTDIYN